MDQIKEMLMVMGFQIVIDEMKTTEWTEYDSWSFVEPKQKTITVYS